MYVITVVIRKIKAPMTLLFYPQMFIWYWSVKITGINPAHVANSVKEFIAIVRAINHWNAARIFLGIEIDTDTWNVKGGNSGATLTRLVSDFHYVSKLNGRTICSVGQFQCHVRAVRRKDTKATEAKDNVFSIGYGCMLTNCMITAPWQNVFIL